MNKTTRIGTALAVVGGTIAVAPALALELGEFKVQSTLGQPLRASVAYALGPNETVTDTCVTLQRVRGGDTPFVTRGAVTVADGVISVVGSAVINEPVVSMRLSIRCPYTPRLMRDFTVFVDSPAVRAAQVEQSARQPVVAAPVASATVAVAPPAPRQPAVSREPIFSASEYRVQQGDSLSLIAQRVEDAAGGPRETADAIFAANPDAFMDNDPNRIKAGSLLTIPGQITDVAPPSNEPAAIDSAPVASVDSVYEPEVAQAPEPAEPVAAAAPAADPFAELRDSMPEPEAVEPMEFEPAPAAEPLAELIDEIPEAEAVAPQDELRPGDIIIEPAASVAETPVEAPQAASSAPDASTSIIRQPTRQEPEPTNWLLWAGGGVAALILALLAFGGPLRDRFGSKPIAPAKPKSKPAAREAVEPIEAVEETVQEPTIGDVDIEISDDSPTAENLALDADLFDGTGLSETSDVDVASDFAFAATTDLDLDLELTKEMAEDAEPPETDIIPPPLAEESSILKSEVLPEGDDDDYDMSVIVDATKMPDPSDVTERDLAAIPVDDDDDTQISGDYTLNQEADFTALEQDYEDELTATQLLNEEIQKATEDQAANDDTALNPTVSMEADDDTVEMPSRKDNKAG